jgi:hypothetical protein
MGSQVECQGEGDFQDGFWFHISLVGPDDTEWFVSIEFASVDTVIGWDVQGFVTGAG